MTADYFTSRALDVVEAGEKEAVSLARAVGRPNALRSAATWR
jgi:hypothetical protein